jgi:hypothetical protein
MVDLHSPSIGPLAEIRREAERGHDRSKTVCGLGLARNTVRAALASGAPPKYERSPGGSVLMGSSRGSARCWRSSRYAREHNRPWFGTNESVLQKSTATNPTPADFEDRQSRQAGLSDSNVDSAASLHAGGPSLIPCDFLVGMTSAGDEGEGFCVATWARPPGPKLLVTTGREPASCPWCGWYPERFSLFRAAGLLPAPRLSRPRLTLTWANDQRTIPGGHSRSARGSSDPVRRAPTRA